MYDFQYIRPASVADAVKALASEDAQALSGGQTLLPTLKQRLARPSALVDLTKIADLVGISVGADTVTVKAATTHAAVSAHEGLRKAIPALAALAGHIGDPQVRNRGTIGGSVANDDPAACYPAAVLGLGATVITNAREIAADDFFQGMFTTALEEGEIITAVRFPIPQAANYQKFLQPASRFALTGVFAARFASGARVAVTGAADTGVFRWTEAEKALSANWSPDAVAGLSVSPDGMLGDIHASPEYRAHLVTVMTRRAVAAA
ncbi:MAG: carbon monoxide dehydrogenase [Rhodobacterales bacterium CG18_big_fil_WC_8_21_14_2_50_71_9]|nr:xanthine dehydrogenase family protein subunit M [Roseovarius sp.]PIP98253.1 MAG: carbon monoxide dehydrogenase [Rhodobacterales bacterium CG18_big_fil_WC_8_21_14_2_50_71_9]PIY72641.1 MAG: carbon monoxide dehydrogenase [Rhodobacterales bacterium CG_4_10_14_0_8_um_filter_70_9]PJA60238.1 MAG: carbon monoxide dehydrogenase [Rhodobacterales bacterium CG_4_9_14_3_um_filter_71_31]